jgi:hypothetical protein
MSLLMFSHELDGIAIVTDTLATATDGTPSFFKTKAFPIPHLQMVVAMTGIANVGERLVDRMFTSTLARDIDMAAQHTTAILAAIVAELRAEFGSLDGSSTIYFFGYSPSHGRYVRYVFRSTNGFRVELSTDSGFGVKPHPAGPFEPPSALPEMVGLAERVRSEQAAMPEAERVHIGGQLMLTVLRGQQIAIMQLHEFADIEQQWHQMHDFHDAWS